MKIERGDEAAAARAFTRMRDVKMCLELECSVCWSDAELVCPACGGREVGMLETFMNRQPSKRPARLRVVERANMGLVLAGRARTQDSRGATH